MMQSYRRDIWCLSKMQLMHLVLFAAVDAVLLSVGSADFRLLLSKARQFVWVLFWFLVLGPKIFAFGFLASIAFKTAHYSWFNWVTHQKQDGRVEIRDLDGGIYRLINLISANLYFHGSHHSNMKLFNPKKFVSRRAPR